MLTSCSNYSNNNRQTIPLKISLTVDMVFHETPKKIRSIPRTTRWILKVGHESHYSDSTYYYSH